MSHVLLCQGTALALPLRDASVHCCVTSPPYYGLRDYGTGTWQGGDPACTHTRIGTRDQRPRSGLTGGLDTIIYAAELQDKTRCRRCGATRVDAQLGLEASVEEYVAAMVQVFREVHRVLRPDGLLFLNMGDSYAGASVVGDARPGSWRADGIVDERAQRNRNGLGSVQGLPAKNLLGMPWRLAFALQQDGWILRSDIIWDKPSCMPESVQDRPTRSHEYVFLFSKQAHYHYDAEAVKEESAYPGDMRHLRTDTRKALDPYCFDNGTRYRTGNPTGSTRNARTVWRIASEPFSGSHFATFPSALVRRCLLAGAPSQVCRACSAPYIRVTERTFRPMTDRSPAKLARASGIKGIDISRHDATTPRGYTDVATLGWHATCPCLEYSCTTCGFVLESSYDITKHHMPHMRKDIPASTPAQHVLQPSVLQPESTQVARQGLPSVRQTLSSESTRHLPLQQSLCVQDDCPEPLNNQGLDTRSKGLYSDPTAEPSQCLERGICDGASSGDVNHSGQATPPDRSGTPQEQRQSRQQTRKPRSDGKKSPRQHEAANVHSHVSALSCDVSHPRPCPRCPGEVSLHPPSTKPSTVLDIFCGSGTTLLVARELGHHAVGVDLSWDYLSAIARERLSLSALARWEGQGGHATPDPAYTDLPLFATGGR